MKCSMGYFIDGCAYFVFFVKENCGDGISLFIKELAIIFDVSWKICSWMWQMRKKLLRKYT